MHRAYSQMTIKAYDDERREFTGIATTPTPDRVGDIVEPLGAKFSLPIPLLWQHNANQPIGEVISAKATKAGIEIKGRVMKATESRRLRERLEEAWESIKIGLVKGLSIGFTPLEQAQIKDSYSYHFLKWDWHELSAVTIPANMEASIQSIKSIDRQQRAASGQREGVVFLGDDPRRVGRKKGVVYLDAPTIERIKT
jgi:HK97 family phage prohead protease